MTELTLRRRFQLETRRAQQKVMGWLQVTLANTTLRDLAVLAAFFTVAHGLLLLDYAPRWDGWIIYHRIQDRDWRDLFQWGREMGLPLFAYLHYLVGHLPYFVFWYKFTTFTCLLTATLVTYHLLGDFPSLGRADRVLLCMLTATFPANLVNIELIMMPFAVFYVCFVLAVAAYRRALRSRGAFSVSMRVASLGLFYISFMMQSLLVFYAAFLLYAALTWPANPERPGPRLDVFVRQHGDFIVLPLLFWAAKSVWFRPFGHYDAYNAFNLHPVSLTAEWALALWGGLFIPLSRGVEALRELPVIAVVVLSVVLLFRPMWASAHWERQGRLAVVGCGLVFVGLLPYVVVGKHTGLGDLWSGRFAYLVPPGAAFLVYGGLKWYLPFLGASRPVTMAAASLVVTACATANISNYLTFGVDALKQEAIVLGFRAQPQIAAAATVVVEDSAQGLSAYERDVRFYEYNGMLKQAFGDERRLGILHRRYQDRAYMDMAVSPTFGKPWFLLSQYDTAGPLVRVRLQPKRVDRNLHQLYLTTVYLRLRSRTAQRDSLIRSLLSVQVLPPEAPPNKPAMLERDRLNSRSPTWSTARCNSGGPSSDNACAPGIRQ